ncbi:MAG: hypothetical protein COX57_00735 [Alphaproteobacteria bacterium CG_4_10_14_0_2_um_filter_63_37]|nr:MAG: hypothetical protein COX57_00735 [Alphaproteobacteria bacterium CG_4_10_14_0_2_um_filter_63_37]
MITAFFEGGDGRPEPVFLGGLPMSRTWNGVCFWVFVTRRWRLSLRGRAVQATHPSDWKQIMLKKTTTILLFSALLGGAPLVGVAAEGTGAPNTAQEPVVLPESFTFEDAVDAYHFIEFEEAIPMFKGLIARGDHVAESNRYLGIIAYQEGRTEEALNYFDQAFGLNPDDREGLQWWCEAMERLGRLEETHGFLRAYLDRHPDDIEIAGLLAINYGKTRDKADARHIWEAVLDSPYAEYYDIARAHYHLALLAWRDGDELEVRRNLQAILADPDAFLARALRFKTAVDQRWPALRASLAEGLSYNNNITLINDVPGVVLLKGYSWITRFGASSRMIPVPDGGLRIGYNFYQELYRNHAAQRVDDHALNLDWDLGTSSFRLMYNHFRYGGTKLLDAYQIDYGRDVDWGVWGGSLTREIYSTFSSFNTYDAALFARSAGEYDTAIWELGGSATYRHRSLKAERYYEGSLYGFGAMPLPAEIDMSLILDGRFRQYLTASTLNSGIKRQDRRLRAKLAVERPLVTDLWGINQGSVYAHVEWRRNVSTLSTRSYSNQQYELGLRIRF